MAIFKGSGVALVTPMKENGQVDFDVLEALLEDQLKNGTDAFIICGTTHIGAKAPAHGAHTCAAAVTGEPGFA